MFIVFTGYSMTAVRPEASSRSSVWQTMGTAASMAETISSGVVSTRILAVRTIGVAWPQGESGTTCRYSATAGKRRRKMTDSASLKTGRKS